MSSEQHKLELGAAATGLLNSLRSFEQARQQYYNAYAAIMGDYLTNEQWEKEASTWKAVEGLIEGALSKHLHNWACEAKQRSII